MRNICWILSAVALLCINLTVSMGAEIDTGKRAEAFKAILGSDAEAWTITGDYALTSEKGFSVLSTAGVVSLTGSTRYTVPSEYLIAFRLRPKPADTGSISVSVGCADLADGKKQAFTATAGATPESGYVNYSCSIQPETEKAVSGNLYLQAVTDRSLAWSEEMRKTIEAQIAAAPKLNDMLFTLRLVVGKEKYSAWLNERFIGQMPVSKGLVPQGTINIVISNDTELASVRVLPYRDNGRFQPLPLDGFVNASSLIDDLPVKNRPSSENGLLGGVYFRFPEKDAAGNDHLSLAPSWSRFGALSGWIAANFGTFGGRWIAADRIDPSRFCMYVPYGQYKALHLIAAYDGKKETVPIVSAQFYRPDAGHPMNFSRKVLLFSAKTGGAKAFPVKLANGQKGNLYHVIIPIDPDKMAWFSDLPRVGLELTKAVQPYRSYPDPLDYSWHAAGLPSGVHIYAATLEKTGVDVDPQPDAAAHVWTAPAKPGYTINLTNNTGKATKATLTITNTSYDGKYTARQKRMVKLPAGNAVVPVKVNLQPAKYGLHDLKVTCTVGKVSTTYTRNFAYLHPDTRERGDWEQGKGPIIGYWSLAGGHDTPDAITELTIMSQLGVETTLSAFEGASKEVRDLAEKYQLKNRQAFSMQAIYVNSLVFTDDKYDRKNPEATKNYLLEELRKLKIEKSPLNIPEYLPFFPEPQIGRLSSGIFPHHYNGGEYIYSKEDEDYFNDRLNLFLIGARAVKEEWPEVKILLPYGDPMYTAQFLAKSPEARELIDGSALDLPLFERLPEQQINQVVLNRLYPIFQDIKKYKKDPYFVMTEGPAVSSTDVDTTEEEHANLCTRNMLALFGYGVNNHESANQPFDCANYWGENHYGGGLCTRLPKAMPKLAYVSSATMTRHLNRRNFVKYVSTGSTSVYCQQYKHYKTGQLGYVLWTIRGKRDVSIKVPHGATVEVFDVNDNPTVLKEKNGLVTFSIAQSPVYLEGMSGEAEITLGQADHSDAKQAKGAVKITNLGNGDWTLAAKREERYEKTNPLQIERFLGNMSAKTVAAPTAQGGKALAVHLGTQEIDRRVMPYYTTIEPKSSVVIPGKSSHLGIWVKAASDWGRVVYSLRDANDEQWLSVGTKEDWNCDDMRCWSAFCFDGWRYLRFEMPSNAPFDLYKEKGFLNWGSYDGDGIIDLPLKLEKIIVERHSSVIYGNDLVPAKADDVLLGDIYAEYAAPADKTEEAIRLSKLRMPAPANTPDLGNPIGDMEKSGIGSPTQVLGVRDPDHWYDGTRCHVDFAPVDGATGYDIWVSPYADGRGAMQLGAGWTESGKLIEGLHADTDFYVFVVYTDRDGNVSKPSQPLKIRLKNKFVYR